MAHQHVTADRLIRAVIDWPGAQGGDDEGDVFVRLVLDEAPGLGPRPGLAEDGPALFVDAVDQDRQQQAVVGVVEVE